MKGMEDDQMKTTPDTTICVECGKRFDMPPIEQRTTMTEEVCPACIASFTYQDTPVARQFGCYDNSDADYRDSLSERLP